MGGCCRWRPLASRQQWVGQRSLAGATFSQDAVAGRLPHRSPAGEYRQARSGVRGAIVTCVSTWLWRCRQA